MSDGYTAGPPGDTLRVALISDLHSNLPALDAVFAHIDGHGIDRVVCLGDIVDLGPQPNEVVQRLRERGVTCIRGNHDSLDDEPVVPVLREIEQWTAEVMTAANRAWLDALPHELRPDVGGLDLLCVHGAPSGIDHGIVPGMTAAALDERLADTAFDVVACGHTHVQLIRRVGARTVVNVGSTSMPFVKPVGPGPPEVLPWAEYAALDVRDGVASIELIRVAYDVALVHDIARRVDMPGWATWSRGWVAG